jgi:5-formyltetrahydrofolate cyclo-ligase
MAVSDRASLRSSLRRQRRELGEAERHSAARQVCRRVVTSSFFLKSRRVAFYFANDGELDPLAMLFRALHMGKRCFLPVVSSHRPDRVSFAPYRSGDVLVPNHWGILEPDQLIRRLVTPRSLDLVFVPLVGFDEHCNRIGMGKGFYDRTFAYRSRLGFRRPLLVGLAYECQKAATVPTDDWDVPLDLVVTEQAVYRAGESPAFDG